MATLATWQLVALVAIVAIVAYVVEVAIPHKRFHFQQELVELALSP